MASTVEQPLWEPSAERRERATLTRYWRWVSEREGRAFADYDELWQWSVQEPEAFWASIWDFCEVRASRPYGRVLAERSMPGARWFVGAELNYAENLLLGHDDADVALLSASEARPLTELRYGDLRAEVARIAGG